MDYIPVYDERSADARHGHDQPRAASRCSACAPTAASLRRHRAYGARGRHRGGRRAPHRRRQSEIRGLDREARCQHNRPGGAARRSAARGSTAPIWCWRNASISSPARRRRAMAGRLAWRATMQTRSPRALSRLKNWDIAADSCACSRQRRAAHAIRAPIGGIVMEKTASQACVWPGDMLYRIVDLSTVWLLADVFEQDLAQIRPGQSARQHGAGLSRPRLRGPVAFSTRPSTRRPAPPRCASRCPTPICCSRPTCTRRSRSRRRSRPPPCWRCRIRPCSIPARDKLVLSTAARGASSRARSSSGARGGGYVAVLEGVARRREGRHRRQFPDRCREQSRAALQAFTRRRRKSP